MILKKYFLEGQAAIKVGAAGLFEGGLKADNVGNRCKYYPVRRN